MTPEAQRIAIAEACGILNGGYVENGHVMRHLYGDQFEQWDPLSDLNAMHEAEKVLRDKQRPVYFEAICVVLKIPEGFLSDLTAEQMFAITCAIAAERAEAFLRTIGKWEE